MREQQVNNPKRYIFSYLWIRETYQKISKLISELSINIKILISIIIQKILFLKINMTYLLNLLYQEIKFQIFKKLFFHIKNKSKLLKRRVLIIELRCPYLEGLLDVK